MAITGMETQVGQKSKGKGYMIAEGNNNRVLVLYQSASTACGIGTWVEILSQALQLQGWDVTVALAWGNHFHNPANIEAFRPGLTTIRMDGRSGTAEGRVEGIERSIRRIRPEVVILTVLDSGFEAVRRLRYEGLDFRFIVVNHGNLSMQAAAMLEHKDIIDMAVCVSQLSFDAMKSIGFGFESVRLRHIPNAVHIPAKIRQRKGVFRVGYAGRLDCDKRAEDIEPFFRAVHALRPEIEFWIAGRGKQGANLERLAFEFPNQVRYFGELDRSQLGNEFYPGLDVLVHFSPSEAWGYSIAEAMAQGVVPVTSAFRGIYSDGLVIDGENAIVFPVGQTQQAADSVATLFSDPPRLGRYSKAAKQHVQKHFSLEYFAQEWHSVLGDCLRLPVLERPERPVSLDRKGKFGLPVSIWELLRRLFRIRINHASPGEEWPHFKCVNSQLIREMDQGLVRSDRHTKSGNSLPQIGKQ